MSGTSNAHAGISHPFGAPHESSGKGDIWTWLRPWWSYPYGHPQKTQGIRQLQEALKPHLEGFAHGFLAADKRDTKSLLIIEISKALSKKLQEGKK